VYFVFIMETIQTALTGVDAYNWFSAGFGNLERLQNTNFVPIDAPIFVSMIGFVVRTSFCYRIWAIEKAMFWWCGIIEAVIFSELMLVLYLIYCAYPGVSHAVGCRCRGRYCGMPSWAVIWHAP
jgi:hypothetical protein